MGRIGCALFGHVPVENHTEGEGFEINRCGGCGRLYMKDWNKDGPNVVGTITEQTADQLRSSLQPNYDIENLEDGVTE